MLRRESPVTRFVVMILLIVALALFGTLGTIDYLSVRTQLRAELRTSARVMADQLAASLALPVWNFDQPQLDKIAESVLHDREAAGVIIRMNDVSSGGGFKTYGLVRSDAGNAQSVTAEQPAMPAGALLEERPILAAGEQVGSVKVFYTPHFMELTLRDHLTYQVAMFIAFGAILTASLYLLLWRTVLQPLRLIEQYAGYVSSGVGARLTGSPFRGELQRLRASIEKMVDLLAARYGALQRNEAMLASQLRFEELVAGISAQLVAARPDNLLRILSQALEDIGRMLDADRVVLGRTDEQTGEMIASAHYRRTEPPFPERLVISERYPGLWRTLREGRVSHIRAVADLGVEEAVDRRHFEEVGIQTQVTAPVMVEGCLRYILAVASVGRSTHWSDEAVARIKVLAEVLATTTLRCEAEEVVRSSERQFRTFIEQAPVPIILVPSPDGAPIYFNPAFTRVFGYTRDDLHHPDDWWPLIYPDPAYRSLRHAAWKALLMKIERSGGFLDADEAEMRTKSGDLRFAQVRLTVLDGYRMSFINDLTERRQAELAEHAYTRRIQKLATELTRAEERQRRELATILHDEVGQNLFAATTLLLTIRDRVDGSRGEVDKALTLLDQVTRDTRELTFELCPPVLYQLGLVPALQRLADQFAARYGITCTLTGRTAGPVDLNARGLAYHAVRELLNNVAKHAAARRVTIDVREEDGNVRIAITDDGAGFEPARLRPGAGGFGLFHLRERVELLGGSLAIESAPGRGCAVQLSLPLNVLQNAE